MIVFCDNIDSIVSTFDNDILYTLYYYYYTDKGETNTFVYFSIILFIFSLY